MLHTILLNFQQIEETFVANRDVYMSEFDTIYHNGTLYIASGTMEDIIYQNSVYAEWEPNDIMDQFMDDLAEYP
jgi:hypothetical protein